MVKGNFLTNTVLYKTAILNGNKVILFPNLLDFYMKFIVMFVIVIIYTRNVMSKKKVIGF